MARKGAERDGPRSIEDILEEARYLRRRFIKEIQLIVHRSLQLSLPVGLFERFYFGQRMTDAASLVVGYLGLDLGWPDLDDPRGMVARPATAPMSLPGASSHTITVYAAVLRVPTADVIRLRYRAQRVSTIGTLFELYPGTVYVIDVVRPKVAIERFAAPTVGAASGHFYLIITSGALERWKLSGSSLRQLVVPQGWAPRPPKNISAEPFVPDPAPYTVYVAKLDSPDQDIAKDLTFEEIKITSAIGLFTHAARVLFCVDVERRDEKFTLNEPERLLDGHFYVIITAQRHKQWAEAGLRFRALNVPRNFKPYPATSTAPTSAPAPAAGTIAGWLSSLF